LSRRQPNSTYHGNNVENFWEGNSILETTGANGFQNQFTGTIGNLHISWLEKLNTDNGNLLHSTYVAEMGQGTTGIGSPHPNPLINGWPNPNSGWLNVNTTRLVQNTVKTTADGSVIIMGTARRPMTTSNANFQSVHITQDSQRGRLLYVNITQIYHYHFTVLL